MQETDHTGRHAYLIMGHNNPWQLSTLIRLLDDARNDLFVHIDKKSTSFPMDIFENLTQASRLVLLPRKECRWAEFSQVEVELDLLQEAAQTGTYDYYHLLSGHDLPLKTQEEIHAFFDAHSNEEFIGYFGGVKRIMTDMSTIVILFLSAINSEVLVC